MKLSMLFLILAMSACGTESRFESYPTGNTGATGASGVSGMPGTNGVNGLPGIQGPQGVKGNTGASGAKGEPGLGSQGPKGATGNTGAKGDTGPQGLKGDAGQPGHDGNPGPSGSQGPTGEKCHHRTSFKLVEKECHKVSDTYYAMLHNGTITLHTESTCVTVVIKLDSNKKVLHTKGVTYLQDELNEDTLDLVDFN